MLKSVNKFLNVLLVSNWKNCSNFLISISRNITWTRSNEDRRDWNLDHHQKTSFYFFNFFL